MYGNRVMEISVIDFGVPATLELTDLREIPPLLLKDFIIIPPQVSYLSLFEVMEKSVVRQASRVL